MLDEPQTAPAIDPDLLSAGFAPPLRKIVRGADKLTGVQPDLLDHWNNLQDEFDKAGLRPEIKSGFRTVQQQQALYNNPATRARTKGNDGINKISPHQEGRALDISFPAPQKAKGHQIISDYARRNGLTVPSDEPWHIAIPKATPTIDPDLLNAGYGDEPKQKAEAPNPLAGTLGTYQRPPAVDPDLLAAGTGQEPPLKTPQVTSTIKEVDDEPTTPTAKPIPFQQGTVTPTEKSSLNPIKNLNTVLTEPDTSPRGIAGLQAKKYESPESHQLGDRVTLPISPHITPSEDEVVNGYLSTLGPDYVKAGEQYKAQTGHSILTLGGGALKQDEKGNYYVRPSKGAVDFINTYVKSGGDLNAAGAEAKRQADEYIVAQNKAFTESKPDVTEAKAAMETAKGSPVLRGMIGGTAGAAQAFGSVLPGSLGDEFQRQAAVEKAATEQVNKDAPLTNTADRIKAGIGGLIPTAAMLIATHKLGPAQLAALGILEGSTPQERLRGGLQGATAQAVLGGAPAAFNEAGLPTTGKVATGGAMVAQPAVEAYQRGESPTQAITENLPFAVMPFLHGKGGVEKPTEIGIDRAQTAGVPGEATANIDARLAERETKVQPTFLRDDQGNPVARVLNPEEVAQGAKPKVRPIHQSDTQARAADGTFAPEKSQPASEPNQLAQPATRATETTPMAEAASEATTSPVFVERRGFDRLPDDEYRAAIADSLARKNARVAAGGEQGDQGEVQSKAIAGSVRPEPPSMEAGVSKLGTAEPELKGQGLQESPAETSAPPPRETVAPTSVPEESPSFNWHTRERDGQWAIVKPDGTEVSRVADREVAEQIVKEMRERPDESQGMSLGQALRAKGGVRPDDVNAGEWSRLSNKEIGSTGLVNRKNGQSEEDIAQSLAEDGYGWGDWAHRVDDHGLGKGVYDVDLDRFREAIESDVSGRQKQFSNEVAPDHEAEYRQYLQTQQDEHDADQTVSLLENEQSGGLFDKIVSGEATQDEVNQFRQHATDLGISPEAQDKLIASAREGGIQETESLPPESDKPVGDQSERPEYLTGAKVDVTRAEREARGLNPVEKQAYTAVGPAYEEGKAWVDGGGNVRKLAQEVSDTPRPLTSRDVGALAYDRARLINGHADTMKQMNDLLDAKKAGKIDDATFAEKLGDLNSERDQIERDLSTNDEALERGGREQSAAFNARKMLIRDDYSLAKMITKVKAAQGGKDLDPELRKQLETVTADLEKAQKELEDYRNEAVNRAARDELQKILRQEGFQKRQVVRGVKSDVLKAEFKTLSSAFGRIIDTRPSANPLFDPELYKLIGQMTRNLVQRGITTAEGITDALQNEIRNHLPEITSREVKEAWSGYGLTARLSADEVAKQLRQVKSEQRDLLAYEDVGEGKRPLRTGLQRDEQSPEARSRKKQIRDLMREKGIEIEQRVPNPETQMKSALDATKTRLKNRIDDLNLLLSGKTKETRGRPVQLDDEAKMLTAERDRLQGAWDEMQKAAKPNPDPAQQRIETALKASERSIADLETRIKQGDTTPRSRQSDAWSVELGKAKQRQSKLQDQLAAMRKAANQPTEEELASRQIKIAEDALQKSVDEYDRRIKENDFGRKAAASAAWSPKISDLKKTLSGLQDRYEKARENSDVGAGERIQREIEATNKKIADLEERVRTGNIDPRTAKKTEQQWTPALGKAKQRQTQLQSQLDALRKAAKPALTPEEAALKRYRGYLDRREADLERQITQAEILGRPLEKVKQRYTLDPKDIQKQADVKRLKDRLDQIVADTNWKNRGTWDKVSTQIVKIRRMVALSSSQTLGKLGSFAIQRHVTTPIESALELGYSKLPFFGSISAKAPRRGGHAFLDGEIAAAAKAYSLYAEFVANSAKLKSSTLSDIAFRGKKSDIDAVFGRSSDFPPEFTNFFGQLHQAIKDPVKEAEFERSMTHRLAFLKKQGLDVTDPAVLHAAGAEAYIDAQRQILMQDNVVSKGFRGAQRWLEQNGYKNSSKALAFIFPVHKVPPNFLTEGAEYSGAAAAYRTAKMIIGGGVKNLSPQQADAVMRAYSKGTLGVGLGTALMALGYFNADHIGGYYQPGEKRKETDVPWGGVRMFGVNVPPFLAHNPLLVPIQLGATVRRVFEAQREGGKTDLIDAAETAGLAGVKGAASQIPFYEEPARLLTAADGRGGGVGRYAGELIGGAVSPPDLQRGARIFDQEKSTGAGEKALQFAGLKQIDAVPRTPQGFFQGAESKFPGLRKNIPENEWVQNAKAHDAIMDRLRSGDVPSDSEFRSEGFTSAQIKKMEKDANLTPLQVGFSSVKPETALDRFERMDARQRYQVQKQMEHKAFALKTRADYLLNNASPEDKEKRQQERDALQKRLDDLKISPRDPKAERSTANPFKIGSGAFKIPAMK